MKKIVTVPEVTKGAIVLTDNAKRSKYPYIYQFLIEHIYDERLAKCSLYVENNAHLFYDIVVEFIDDHPIPEHDMTEKDLMDDDLCHDLLYDVFYKTPKLDSTVYDAIFTASPFPAYMDPGASTHIDDINEEIYEIAFEGFQAFYRDYWQKLKEQKELRKKFNTINNELKALPPSLLLPLGGIEYQEALERNIDKFM